MLNNRGQSLVLFIVFLPIILLVFVLVIDILGCMTLKQELNSISQIVLDYGLDKLGDLEVDNENDSEIIDEEKLDSSHLKMELVDLIKLNKKDIDTIDVKIVDDRIYIDLIDKDEGVLTGLINVLAFDVKSSYVGYLENGEKRIEIVGE